MIGLAVSFHSAIFINTFGLQHVASNSDPDQSKEQLFEVTNYVIKTTSIKVRYFVFYLFSGKGVNLII